MIKGTDCSKKEKGRELLKKKRQANKKKSFIYTFKFIIQKNERKKNRMTFSHNFDVDKPILNL